MHLLTAVLLTVTVRTYDIYGLAARDLQTAIRTASATLAAAGVVTDWIDCSGAASANRCRTVPDRFEIVVRISAAPDGRDASDALGHATVDTVLKEGAFATLFADRVADRAAAAGCDVGTVLGRAAAHEIGHLLMGTTGHSPRGLMRARWFRSDLQRRFERDWRFTAQEGQQMREHLAERIRIARAASEVTVASSASSVNQHLSDR